MNFLNFVACAVTTIVLLITTFSIYEDSVRNHRGSLARAIVTYLVASLAGIFAAIGIVNLINLFQ